MELRLTVLDPERAGARADLEIDAPAGTSLAAVSARLYSLLGRPGHLPVTGGRSGFCCNGMPVSGGALLGLPPLLYGAVLTLARSPGPNSPSGTDNSGQHPVSLLELHTIAGPDAGGVVPLRTGLHTAGRAASSSIRLADQEVSREHAELVVDPDRVSVRDLGSSNGTWLGQTQLGIEGDVLQPGATLRLGRSLLALRGPDRPPAAVVVDGEGCLIVNRSPLLRPADDHPEIRFPTEPVGRPPSRFPWPATLLPLLMAVPTAVLVKQPGLLLFALMTPVLMVFQYVNDRRSTGRDRDRGLAHYEMISARSRAALELAVTQDAARLEAERPDLARLTVTARIPTDELWRRTRTGPGFLSLRVGRGPEPAALKVRRAAPELMTGDEGDDGSRTFTHPDVPLAVDLAEIRVLGVCGPRRSVLGLARSLIGQIAVLHSPGDVRLKVLTADPRHSTDWHWAGWLPHHDPAVFDGSGATGTGGRGTRRRPAWRVVVLDGSRTLREHHELAAVLSAAARLPAGSADGAPDQDLLLICLDETEQSLPKECRAVVTLDALDPPDTLGREDGLHRQDAAGPSAAWGDGVPGATAATDEDQVPRTALLRRDGRAPTWFAPDLAGARWAERLCRYLAPLRDADVDRLAEPPAKVRLVEVVADHDQVDPTSAADLGRHWRRTPLPRPTATLGCSAAGPFRIDLLHDGPHLLIGGTTGAGKSELLQTLVTALAVDSAPDDLSFLLIDYKGGAAFRECAGLPQVVGTITDLDPHLAERALASLAAELRRRERLLAVAGAADLDAYRTARASAVRTAAAGPLLRDGSPALPRLVVVVDEFRVLAEELPEFVSGLIRIATVGRSLGVHLVLATQRPGGVVSAEISANVNLRIALRVRDGGDSRDLIDDPGAALLPGGLPGRALARSGADPLVLFQTAQVSGRAPGADALSPVVRRLTPATHGSGWTAPEPVAPSKAATGQPTDLARIAAAARNAAERLGLPAVVAPWLPPLPTAPALDDVLARDRICDQQRDPQWDQVRDAAGSPSARNGRPQLLFGLIDLPDEQRQEPVGWRLGGAHLAVVGGPRSGRTTVVRCLVQAAADLSVETSVETSANLSVETSVETSVRGVSAGATAPSEMHLYLVDGSGALAGLKDLPPVKAVLAVNDVERAERLLTLLSREIATRRRDAGSSAAPVVLLIDGWEALTASWNEVDHGRLVDQLMAVLRDGLSAGVHAVVTGGRSLLTGAVSSLLADRVVLRFADAADALLAGVPAAAAGRVRPPGRGLLLSPDRAQAHEIQVAVPAVPPGAGPTGSNPSGGLGAASHERWLVPELPSRLEYEHLFAEHRRFAERRRRAATGQQAPAAAQVAAGKREAIGRQEALGMHVAIGMHGRRLVPVGIGGENAEPLVLDLDLAPVTLVLGPPGSGRTSALHSIAEGLRRLGEPVVTVTFGGPSVTFGGPSVSSARSAGVAPDVIEATLPWAAHRLSELLVQHPELTVLVDDVPSSDSLPALVPIGHDWIGPDLGAHDRAGRDGAGRDGAGRNLAGGDLAGPEQAAWVSELLTGPSRPARLVLASSAAEVLTAYRGLAGLARAARSGLLLGDAQPSDAEVFGLRLSRRPPGPAGRALLVRAGTVQTVQLALPPEGDAAETHTAPLTQSPHLPT